MIGCIVTGHGSFAPGMLGAVEMIAGPQNYFELVPFHEEASLDSFEAAMNQAVEELLTQVEGIVIFSDLLGGTPFKTAMLAAAQWENVEVVAGTNLPVLIEGSVLRGSLTVATELIDQILEAGKNGLVHAQLDLANTGSRTDEEEGI